MKEISICRLILFLIILAAVKIYPESSLLNDARAAEKTGKYEDAVQLYNKWLNKNTGSDDYYEILIHMLSIEKNPEMALKFQKGFENKINSENKSDFYERMARTEEMLGYIDEAEKSYRKAWLSSGRVNSKALLSSAVLLFSMGKKDAAEKTAKKVSSESKDNSTIIKSLILLANIYESSGWNAKAEKLLLDVKKRYKNSELMPAVLASLFKLYKKEKNAAKSDQIFKELQISFPDSIYYAIVNPDNSNIELFPNPGLLFNMPTERAEKEIKTYSVQAGSFSVEENAIYLVKDLKSAGFKAYVNGTSINGRKYFRAIIGPINSFKEAQKVVDDLTQKGYSGFIVK